MSTVWVYLSNHLGGAQSEFVVCPNVLTPELPRRLSLLVYPGVPSFHTDLSPACPLSVLPLPGILLPGSGITSHQLLGLALVLPWQRLPRCGLPHFRGMAPFERACL